MISYYAPNGGYAADEPYFTGSVDGPLLHALADEGAGGNGIYLLCDGRWVPGWIIQFCKLLGGSAIRTLHALEYFRDYFGGCGRRRDASGPTNATVTTDSSGNYSFTGVLNGTYNVTPSAPGDSFTPMSQSITVNSASVSGVNFTVSALPTYTLSGTIQGLGGATVALSGSESATTLVNSSGNYSFTVPSGTYTLTPSMTGYLFSPANQTVSVANANITGVNFTPVQVFSIWSSSAMPGTPSENDPSALEIGVKFQSSVAGSVFGVRFYKGSLNTGTHIGNL